MGYKTLLACTACGRCGCSSLMCIWWFHMPPRKAWHKSMCLQLTGMTHCSLTWCTALTGPYLDAATLCLPGMLCLGQDRGHCVGGVTSGTVKWGFDEKYFAPRCLPDSAHFCNALLLLRLIDSPSKMSLFTIQPGQCCFPL